MKKFSAILVALFAAVSVLADSVNSGAVVIRVVDMDYKFVEGATVSLFDLKGAQIAEAETNEAGLVGFYNLVPGVFTVRVQYDPATALVSRTILVSGGVDVSVEIIQIPTHI